MDRLAAAFILVLLLGIWVHPFISGAKATNRPAPQSAAAGTDPDSAPTSQPTTAPATQRFEDGFKVVVGQPGYWRLTQSKDGVWWFASPANELQFLNTVTTVQPYQLGRDKDGPHFVSKDYSPEASTEPNGGDLDRWAQNTLNRLK